MRRQQVAFRSHHVFQTPPDICRSAIGASCEATKPETCSFNPIFPSLPTSCQTLTTSPPTSTTTEHYIGPPAPRSTPINNDCKHILPRPQQSRLGRVHRRDRSSSHRITNPVTKNLHLRRHPRPHLLPVIALALADPHYPHRRPRAIGTPGHRLHPDRHQRPHHVVPGRFLPAGDGV